MPNSERIPSFLQPFALCNFVFLGCFVVSLSFAACVRGQSDAATHERLAAWGSDHVDQELPDYVTGDECLFCHRNDIGPSWPENSHARTIRFIEPGVSPMSELEAVPALKEFAEQVEFVLGRGERIRYLKNSTRYGHMDLGKPELVPAREGREAKLLHADRPEWDDKTFAESCAGCHATAVETQSRAFAAFAHDCYACHGSVTLNHTNDTSLMLLSKKREDPPEIIASACGQCHLRGGKSRSTGLPYPNQFVAGDNLFKDYEVDLSDANIAKLAPGDRHIFRNVREMTLEGNKVTCLSCHQTHEHSSYKHRSVAESAICADCHPAGKPKKELIAYERTNAVCGY